jgi:hypothetical protein
MNEFALTLLASAATSAALTGFVVWLTKSWISERLKNAIKHEYDQKLETHKAQLKAQSDVETERLKAQLNIAAAEHEVRFSGLHGKRAEMIAEVYEKLVQAHWDASSFVSPIEYANEPSKEEKYATAMKSMAEFFKYYDKRRIYLPQSLCDQLEGCVTEMRSKAARFGAYLRHERGGLSAHLPQQRSDAWDKAWEYFDKEFPVTRAALEKELRALLGDTGANP